MSSKDLSRWQKWLTLQLFPLFALELHTFSTIYLNTAQISKFNLTKLVLTAFRKKELNFLHVKSICWALTLCVCEDFLIKLQRSLDNYHWYRFGTTVDLIFERKTLNICWPKAFGKKDMEIQKNHGMVCPHPKNQKEEKKPSGSYHNHLPHFFWGLWGLFRPQMCPVTNGRVDNCVRVGQHSHACVTRWGSGARDVANTCHYRGLHTLFPRSKKGSLGYFQPLSFDFISINNGSWAF